MVTVPSSLKGKTTLDAHQWVQGMLDGHADYELMSGGARVTLSDITKGNVTDVDVRPLGARVNPAGSYLFKPSHQPQKHSRQFTTRVVTPEGLSPSLVQSMEAAHGTHAAVHMLSKMLSQRSLNMPLSPKGMESLSSFILADPAPVVRRNPIGLRQTPSGLRMARVIGERGRVMDDMMLKEVMNYLQKNEGDYELPTDFPASERQFELFRNAVLQPYLIAVESNRALIKYLNDVLIPHMNRLVDEGSYSKKGLGEAGGVTMTKAKIKQMIARRYDTIVSRLATSCQDFYMGRNEALIAHPAFLYPQMQYILLPPPLKLTGGSRAEVFLYQAGEAPKYGVAVDKIGDKEVGKVVQQMPRHMLAAIKKAQGDADELTFPVARVNNRPIDFANVVNAEVISRSLGAGNVQELLVIAGRFWNDATRRLFKRKGTANSANPLTTEQLHALNELNKVANDLQLSGSMEPVIAALSNVKDGERSLERLPMAVAIEVNIGGIKPRPIRWPESLICCMMKALSDNADQIIRVDGAGDGDKKTNFFEPNLNLLPPSIQSNIKLEYLNNGKTKNKNDHKQGEGSYKNLHADVKAKVEDFFSHGLTLNDLVRKDEGGLHAYAATIALDMATNVGNMRAIKGKEIYPRTNREDARKEAMNKFKELPANPTKEPKDGDNRAVKFLSIVGDRAQDYGLKGSTPKKLSILHIMQLAITNCKTQGYEPTPEEVKFVTHLLMYCIATMDTNVTAFMEDDGPIARLTRALSDAQGQRTAQINRQQQKFINSINESIQGVNALGEEGLGAVFHQLVVNKLLADAFGDALEGGDLMGALGVDILEADAEFVQPQPIEEEEVMENPGHGGPLNALDSLSEQLKESPIDRAVLRQVKNNIDSSNAEIIRKYGQAIPGPDVVNALAEQLKGVFAEAVRQTNEQRQEAQELAAANLRIARLLDRESIEDAEQDAMEGFLELIRNVQTTTSSLLRAEEGFVKEFSDFLPLDPFNARDDEFYAIHALNANYRVLIGQIEATENTARSALSAIRLFTQDEDTLSANEPRINYLAQLIKFCNAMQAAYGEVGGLLDQAMEDMFDDEGGISPYIYRAAFNTADNFNLRALARIKLRKTAQVAATNVDPIGIKKTFFKLYENCLDVIGKLFGAFPSESEMPDILGIRTGYRVPGLKFADDYLVRLIDEGLDFGGDSSDQARRDAIFIEMVSPSEAARRRLEQHKENVAEMRRIQQEQREKALKVAKDRLLGTPEFTTRNVARAAQIFEDLDIQVAQKKKEQETARILDTYVKQGEEKQARERARAEQELFEQETADAGKAYRMYRLLKKEVPEFAKMQTFEAVRDLGLGERIKAETTPEERQLILAYAGNDSKLDTMALTGEITERMRDFAKSKKYHWTTVKAITDGAKKGRDTQAQIKAVESALAKAPEGFQIDTAENIYNDISTKIGLADQQMFDATYMRNPGGVVWYE